MCEVFGDLGWNALVFEVSGSIKLALASGLQNIHLYNNNNADINVYSSVIERVYLVHSMNAD